MISKMIKLNTKKLLILILLIVVSTILVADTTFGAYTKQKCKDACRGETRVIGGVPMSSGLQYLENIHKFCNGPYDIRSCNCESGGAYNQVDYWETEKHKSNFCYPGYCTKGKYTGDEIWQYNAYCNYYDGEAIFDTYKQIKVCEEGQRCYDSDERVSCDFYPNHIYLCTNLKNAKCVESKCGLAPSSKEAIECGVSEGVAAVYNNGNPTILTYVGSFAQLYIPANALPAEMLEDRFDSETNTLIVNPGVIISIDKANLIFDEDIFAAAYSFMPDDLNFIKEMTLTIGYDNEDVINEDNLVVYKYENGELIEQSAALNKEENTLTFNTNHLGIYTAIERDTEPPELSLTADPSIIWPPNHKEVDVKIDGSAVDDLSGIKTVVFEVIDEYNEIKPTINDFGDIIKLIAWRDGNDKDGRHYTIKVTAEDNAGNVAEKEISVIVPYDDRKSEKQY